MSIVKRGKKGRLELQQIAKNYDCFASWRQNTELSGTKRKKTASKKRVSKRVLKKARPTPPTETDFPQDESLTDLAHRPRGPNYSYNDQQLAPSLSNAEEKSDSSQNSIQELKKLFQQLAKNTLREEPRIINPYMGFFSAAPNDFPTDEEAASFQWGGLM